MDQFLLFLAGLAGGFIAGLLGIGGGMVFIIVLPFALLEIGVPESEIVQYTIANSLFGTFFASLSGNIAHVRTKTFYLREVLYIGISGAVASVLFLRYVVNTPYYSKPIFNVFLIVFLSFLLIRSYFIKEKKGEEGKTKRNPLIVSGSLAGAISSLSGLGGGTVVIPMLNNYFRFDVKKAKSISIGMILISTGANVIYNMWATPMYDINYYNYGYIVMPIAISLSLGVMLAAPVGVITSLKMSSKKLKLVFAIFVAMIIVDKSIELISMLWD